MRLHRRHDRALGGGTDNQGLYYVTAVTATTLTLQDVASPKSPWNKPGPLTGSAQITESGAIRLGATFNASQVDADNDTIHFTSPDDFQDGDQIVLDSAGNASASSGGLVSGRTYYVRVVDEYTIQLVATLAEVAPTPLAITYGSYNLATNTVALPGITAPTLVTYDAPPVTSFYAADVNVTYARNSSGTEAEAKAPNNIYLPGAGNTLASGDLVQYQAANGKEPLVGPTNGAY